MKNLADILATLSHYQPVLLHNTPHSAAVMIILLIDQHDELEIVLTKRSATLPTYAGHYSFPGGMRDASDADLYETAIREIHEELNLLPTAYQAVGQLDDFLDHEGHLIRPFISLMKKENFLTSYQHSIAEIEEVYFFSLHKLNKIYDDPKLHAITRRRPSYAFAEEHVFVWGLTATILIHFFNVISGEERPLGKKID